MPPLFHNFNLLSPGGRAFFLRLVERGASDEGEFPTRPRDLQIRLFRDCLAAGTNEWKPPSESSIETWLAECEKAGMVVILGPTGRLKNWKRPRANGAV
jgi:hypothetical protein